MKRDAQRVRGVPVRTCIGCRQARPQRELIRICVKKSGELEPDLRKNKPGRGAYLCARKACWEKGLKKDKLEYALKTKIAPEALKSLMIYYSQQKDDESS